jgi:hypothetical protein
MAMFDWRKKPEHPMHSPEAAASQLADLPTGDARKALEEVNEWIASVKDAPGFKPEVRVAVLEVLDQTGSRHFERLLAEYLSAPQLYEAKCQIRWAKLLAFRSQLLEGYLASAAELAPLVGKSPPLNELFVTVLCRASRAAGDVAKTRHIAYQPVDNSVWERLFNIHRLADACRLAAASVQAYKTDTRSSTPTQELLKVLMLEMASLGNLAPEHVELASRITARVASSFAMAPQAGPGLPFCADVDQPKPPMECAFVSDAPGTTRWFGAGTALARLNEMIKHNDSNALPTDRRFGKEFSDWDKVSVLKHLLLQWSDRRPRRRSERKPASGELTVLHGYDAVRTAVPQTGTAESGHIAEVMKEKKLELTIAAQSVDQVPETWTLKDSDQHGIGAELAPTPELWVKVGKICAVKPPGSETWWAGVVRRLDAGNRASLRVGIEVLSRRPRGLWLKFVGEGHTAAANWETSSGSFSYEYRNVVLLFPEGARSLNEATVLMNPEGFIAESVCEALMGEKSRLLRLKQPVATGDDFVIASCVWLDSSK